MKSKVTANPKNLMLFDRLGLGSRVPRSTLRDAGPTCRANGSCRWAGIAALTLPILVACASEPTQTTTEEPVVQAEAQTLDWSKKSKFIPPEFDDLVNKAGDIVSAFSGITSAIGVVNTMMSLLGLTTDPNTQRFADLHKHLDEIAGKLDWKISELDRQNNIQKASSAVAVAGQVVSSTGQPLSTNSPAYLQSANTVYEAEKDLAFTRQYVDNGIIYGIVWGGQIRYAPEVSAEGQVYDWRIGVPALMHLISLRIHVIAAADPNFAHNKIFSQELMVHRAELQKHYNKMLAGLHCEAGSGPNFGGSYTYNAICADSYSGLSDTWTATHGGSSPNADYTNQMNAARDRMYAELRNALPLFKMRSMMDTLYHYAHPGADLTSPRGDIELTSNTSLCIDLPSGDTTLGTQLQLYGCHEGPNQQWDYDRKSGLIRSRAYDNRCLDVQGASTAGDTPIIIWECHGDRNQQWTWDPESGILENGVGMVLDAWKPAVHTLLTTWGRGANFAGDQSWRSSTCAHDLCVTGGILIRECDPCVTKVIERDPYCSEVAWDGQCVAEVGQFCGGSC